MKRYLIFCLLLVLLLPCMVVPASATTQGVINAQNEANDWLETISETIELWASDWVTQAEKFWDYFFEETETVNDVSGAEVTITGFKYDLIQTKMFVWSWISDVFDTISTNVASIKTAVSSMISTYIRPMSTNVNYIYGILRDMFSGDTGQSDQFVDDMSPIETEVDDWLNQMETAPTINIEDIETEVDKVTEFETDPNYISILSSIFLNEAFLMIFTWCVILAMLGFILYGKR